MHHINRGNGTTTLEALLCFAALFGVVILAYATGWTFGTDVGRDQVTAQQHYEAAKQDALQACAGRIGRAAVECGAKAAEAAQDQSIARQDLYAQQDMAKWAFWMLLASTITLGVSVAGVWFVKRTLDATLVAVRDTGAATRAMRIANVIARKSQASNLAANKAQVRAYLSLVKLRIEDGEKGQVLHYEIVNSGQSPARATDIYWIIARQDFPHLPLHKINPVGDIPAGGKDAARLGLKTQTPWEAFAQPMDIIVVQARAQFTDVFGTRQSDPTEFQMLIDNDGRFQLMSTPN